MVPVNTGEVGLAWQILYVGKIWRDKILAKTNLNQLADKILVNELTWPIENPLEARNEYEFCLKARNEARK